MANADVDVPVAEAVLSSSDEQDIERALSQILDGQLGNDYSSQTGASNPPESMIVLLHVPDNMLSRTVQCRRCEAIDFDASLRRVEDRQVHTEGVPQAAARVPSSIARCALLLRGYVSQD